MRIEQGADEVEPEREELLELYGLRADNDGRVVLVCRELVPDRRRVECGVVIGGEVVGWGCVDSRDGPATASEEAMVPLPPLPPLPLPPLCHYPLRPPTTCILSGPGLLLSPATLTIRPRGRAP